MTTRTTTTFDTASIRRTRTTPVLPEIAAKKLRRSLGRRTSAISAANGGASDDFYINLLAAHYLRKWSYRSLARALLTNHEQIRRALNHGVEKFGKDPDQWSDRVTVELPNLHPDPEPKPAPIVVNDEDRGRMQQLAPLAKQVNGATPLKDRAPSVELTELLDKWRKAGASQKELEAASGIPWNGIRMRLARHGRITLPPSQNAYQGRMISNRMDDNWEWFLPALDKWVEKHGPRIPPDAKIRGKPLGEIVTVCKRRYAAGLIPPDKLKELKKRGFPWK